MKIWALQIQALRSCLLLFSCLMAAPVAAANPLRIDVNVRAHKKSTRDKVIYTYQLENNSQHAVMVFRVGYNHRDEAPELPATPIGWTPSEGLAQDSTTAPHGWTATLITTEETPFVEIEWRSTDKTQWSIGPGTTSMDFSVVLPQEFPEYERAHFDVVFSNSTRASARMVPEAHPIVLKAQPLSARTLSGQTVAFNLLAETSEGNNVKFLITQKPEYGTLSGEPPSLTYTPLQGFAGTDSLSFKVTNGQAESNTAAVTITVLPEEVSALQADAKTSGVSCSGCSSSAGIEGWQLLVLLASSRFIRRRPPRSG
ncbi:Ig-like domain-containing protein [Archangium sp.]|uniref:Ig-like domain-containing protein n=1 Tax=Archangium sp. TaxID=1872627 RepID=UPI00286B5CD4|nr:Ig-like domain-containing protein [Archangium sp.]